MTGSSQLAWRQKAHGNLEELYAETSDGCLCQMRVASTLLSASTEFAMLDCLDQNLPEATEPGCDANVGASVCLRRADYKTFPVAGDAEDAWSGDGDVSVDVVAVDQVKPFEDGQRLTRNPAWGEIKKSIRASRGLTDILAVTKRPGDEVFTCYHGGNTRLLALQALHRETGDPAFGKVRVEIKPFAGDLELYALHHRENSCRGACSFFDDAWATYRLYKAFCDSQPAKTTARAFLERMRVDHGVSITPEGFSRIKDTVEVLYQHIPTCLVQGGMSLRMVRRLIELRTALKKTWKARSIGSLQEFEDVFYGLLAQQDCELAKLYVSSNRAPSQFPDSRIAIDWQTFKEDMQHEVSVQAGVDYQRAAGLLAGAFRKVEQTETRTAAAAAPLGKTVKPSSAPAESMQVLRDQAYRQANDLGAIVGIESLVRASAGLVGYGVSDTVPASAPPSATFFWWLMAVASGERAVPHGAEKPLGDLLAFNDLAPEALMAASRLFAVHARIAQRQQQMEEKA